MKTTLEIPDPLFRRVKSRAVMQGVKLKDFVPRLLAAGMEHLEAAPKNVLVARKPSPFPLIKGRGGPLLARLDNALIARTAGASL